MALVLRDDLDQAIAQLQRSAAAGTGLRRGPSWQILSRSSGKKIGAQRATRNFSSRNFLNVFGTLGSYGARPVLQASQGGLGDSEL